MLSRRELVDLFHSKIEELKKLKRRQLNNPLIRLQATLQKIIENDLIPASRKEEIIPELNQKIEVAKNKYPSGPYVFSLPTYDKIVELKAEIFKIQNQIIQANRRSADTRDYQEYEWPDCPSQECTCKYCKEEYCNV